MLRFGVDDELTSMEALLCDPELLNAFEEVFDPGRSRWIYLLSMYLKFGEVLVMTGDR